MTTPWTPGFTDSEGSTQSQAERLHLGQAHPTFRDTSVLRTPESSPLSVPSSPVVMSSPPGALQYNALNTAERRRIFERSVQSPPTLERRRGNVGQQHFWLRRRAGSMRYQPISTSDMSGTSTESEEMSSRPSSPCPTPSDIGSEDLLDLESQEECESYIPDSTPSP